MFFNIAYDIMGGGASAPDNLVKNKNYKETILFIGIIVLFVLICISIYFIRNYLDKKRNSIETKLSKQKIDNFNTSELKCLICNEDSNGKHFCKTCFNKYKNATIELKITNIINNPSSDEEEHE